MRFFLFLLKKSSNDEAEISHGELQVIKEDSVCDMHN